MSSSRASAAAAGQSELIAETTPDAGVLAAELSDLKAAFADLQQQLAAVERPSRHQEDRAAAPVHEPYVDQWEEPALLDHPALVARAGMAQMWVRSLIHGEPDHGNVFRALNNRWRPRSMDTIPKELEGVLQVDFRGQQVIGVHGAVLMERPEELERRQRTAYREAGKAQMESVEQNLYRAREPGDRGFGRPRFVERHTEVERGRPAPVDGL